jgi:two-component system, chemotaxis family, protein-glutamate methylesterase/glutaminase
MLTTTATTATVKVLIVDDSAIVRKILTQELGSRAGIEVVGTAPDCIIARSKIAALNPDVLTLDVEMPRMDGITFLRELMQSHPMPVIMLSSITQEGSQKAVEALAAGAVEVFHKPDGSRSVGDVCNSLADKIKAVAKARVRRSAPVVERPVFTKRHLDPAATTSTIFAIGASTGGVQALHCVLSALPADAPGTVVVQHMPPQFTASFAQRLNNECAMHVKEAQHGDRVVRGQVLIAPGGRHMLLQRLATGYSVALGDGPPVCRQRPSVEVLFNSVAKYAGANAIGAILTGMGDDGATGLLTLRQAGAHTIAQDEQSCVVFGMPKEAIARGGAERIVPLNRVAEFLMGYARS